MSGPSHAEQVAALTARLGAVHPADVESDYDLVEWAAAWDAVERYAQARKARGWPSWRGARNSWSPTRWRRWQAGPRQGPGPGGTSPTRSPRRPGCHVARPTPRSTLPWRWLRPF